MKVSELSRRAAVPLPTIKFYIREGLLPAGERTAKNQADYSEEHLERLSLIRALKDDAGLSISTIAKMLGASDRAGANFIEAAIDAIERPVGPAIDESSEEFRAAQQTMLEIGRRMGWDNSSLSGAVRDAARALVRIQRAFPMDAAPVVRLYADLAERIAQLEIPEDWSTKQPRMATLRYAVLGTLLFEPLILSLRRMAHGSRAHALENRARSSNRTGSVNETAATPHAELLGAVLSPKVKEPAHRSTTESGRAFPMTADPKSSRKQATRRPASRRRTKRARRH
jgi:DNA-binding transcriptional MerR regulator